MANEKPKTDDWQFTVGIDVTSATNELNRYYNRLLGLYNKAKSPMARGLITREINRVDNLSKALGSSAVRTVEDKGRNVVSNVVKEMGDELLFRVQTNYTEKLYVRTEKYFRSIRKSRPYRHEDGIYISVGNIPYMMKETKLRKRKSSKTHGKRKKKGKYIADRGPWSGRPITGYYYFQEYGFRARGRFIRNQIFYEKDADEVVQYGDRLLEQKLKMGRY